MSYIINNSRGQVVAVVADGSVNTTATSLTLVGRAVTSYGEAENENYVFLLENFADSSPPTRPVLGQLWYDSSNDVLSVYTSANAWVGLATEDYVQAQKISPIFTGVPQAPTAAPGTNTPQIATTAFVQGEKAGPIFTGVPRAPTAPLGTATAQIATTAFVYSVTGNLGTMSQQNADSVNIAGGSITGIIPLPVTAGGTGGGTATAARTNLGLGSVSTQNANAVNITGGSITGIQDLSVSDGGTGASDAPQARINLGIGTLATQNANAVNITGGSITGIQPIPVASGGTGATTEPAARNNLGLGSMAVQNSDTVAITGGSITGISPLPITAGGTGAATAPQARINLGLGTGATTNVGTIAAQNADAVNITGGSITGISPLPVSSGGTGAGTGPAALNNLGAVPQTRVIGTTGGLAGGGNLSSNLVLSIASNSNGFGNRIVSTSTPTGGNDGDIWYQI